MPQPQDYKSRAVFVRHSARAHLRELRAQRMSKRKSAGDDAAATAGNDAAIDLPPELSTADPAAVADAIEPMVSAEAIEQASELSDAPDATAAALDMPEENGDDLNDLAVESVAMSELSDEVMVAAAPEHPVKSNEPANIHPHIPESGIELSEIVETAPTNVEVQEADHPDPAPATDCGDLYSLPGAGPGLVWMLNQCGVFSLADLAKADPAQLSTSLGVVGQILNVEQWIAFAKGK